MRFATTVFAILASALFAACGPGEAKQDQPSKPADPAIGKPEPGPTPTREPSGPGKRIKGEGKADADGGAEGLKVELGWDEDNQVSGKVQAGPTVYTVDGVLDGEVMRCWLSSGAGDLENARRGTLVGTAGADGSYTGTYAVSNSGASEISRGTWSAKP